MSKASVQTNGQASGPGAGEGVVLGYRMLPREAIRIGKGNPRKFFDPAKLEALAANIAEQGIVQPLIVRTVREGLDVPYELVAGERRWRAAGIAKLDLVPCLVRHMTDREVLEVQYIENLQREDLSAMEEAEGFHGLITAGLYTVETLMEKLNVGRSHVFGRLRLVKLSGPVKEALREGKLEVSLAGLIAKIPDPKHQAEVLGRALTAGGPSWQEEKQPMTFRQLDELIQDEYLVSLKEVPFDVKDKGLDAAAGACEVCPKRTGNMLEMYPELKSPHMCTDPGCFERKLAAWQVREEAQARAAGRTVLTAEEFQKQRRKWVELDSRCYEAPYDEQAGEYPTWRKTLGKHAPEAAVCVLDGRVQEFVAADVVEKIMEERNLASPAAPSEYDQQQAARVARGALMRRVLEEGILEAMERATNCKVEPTFWRTLCLLSVRREGFNDKWLMDRRPQILRDAPKLGGTRKQALEDWIMKRLDPSEQNFRSLLVQTLLSPNVDYNGEPPADVVASLGLLGVNLQAIEARLKEPEAAPKGEKKAQAKGKTKAKGKKGKRK